MLKQTRKLLCCATIIAAAAMAAPGSARAQARAEAVTRLEAGHPVAFDVIMPLRNRDKLEAFVADLHNPASPNFHKWVSPAQFGLRFGPATADVQRVAASLRARGFAVTVQTRSLHVTGTSDQVERNFATHLMLGRTASGTTHIMQGQALTLPAEIAQTGAQIFSFSPHVAHTFARIAAGHVNPDNRYSNVGPYWWTDLKQAYQYPSALTTVTVNGKTQPLDGTGVSLGVLMQGDIDPKDIVAVFKHENYTKISGKPIPKVSRVYINGKTGTNTGAFVEASLDTQEETTGAPGANVTLYDIPDLSDGNVSAGYITIVESNAVDLVSSSFGGCELQYGPAYNGGQSYYGVLAAQHELFLQGNAQGITFLASSGDEAGLECPSVSYFAGQPANFVSSVSTPAADTAVTAVGGTNVVTTQRVISGNSIYVTENAWGDPETPYDVYGFGENVSGGFWGAGGGYSSYFRKPDYQSMVDTKSLNRRALPDVGMQVGGCPGGIAIVDPATNECDGGGIAKDGHGNGERSSVQVSAGGSYYSVIGTSVSSPEFAGAMALLIETQGRMGNLNYYLYNLASQQAAGKGTFFHTGIPGYNGVRQSNVSSTYNLSVGVGTPIVYQLIGQPTAAVAGTPQTPSNP